MSEARRPERTTLDGRIIRIEPLHAAKHAQDLYEASHGPARETIFRQHMIVKGENRDTAWFAMLDGEWPDRKANFERWLDPGNFDCDGRQKTPLRR